jgi:hypothetical protein
MIYSVLRRSNMREMNVYSNIQDIIRFVSITLGDKRNEFAYYIDLPISSHVYRYGNHKMDKSLLSPDSKEYRSTVISWQKQTVVQRSIRIFQPRKLLWSDMLLLLTHSLHLLGKSPMILDAVLPSKSFIHFFLSSLSHCFPQSI